MNNQVYKWFVYFGVLLSFYLLPILIRDTGSGIFILLIVIPLIIFNLSMIYGRMVRFNWYFCFIIGIAFIPSIFIFYNESALIYTLIFPVISIVGQFSGNLLQQIARRKSDD